MSIRISRCNTDAQSTSTHWRRSIPAAQAKKETALTNKRFPIVTTVGTKAYLDLRWQSHTLYQFKELDLPDKYATSYYLPILVTSATKRAIQVLCPLLNNSTLQMDQATYTQYVCSSDTRLSPHVVITHALLDTHPSILTLNFPPNWSQLQVSSEEYINLFDPITT